MKAKLAVPKLQIYFICCFHYVASIFLSNIIFRNTFIFEREIKKIIYINERTVTKKPDLDMQFI